jgi:hypothetical protein
VSRKSRERSLEAQERWPNLFQFLGGYLHQDWPEHSGTPEKAIEDAINGWDLPGRRLVLKEWRDWNSVRGCRRDVAACVNDGLGVEVYFSSEVEARKFMNLVHDKLITSVRTDTGEKWNLKPGP